MVGGPGFDESPGQQWLRNPHRWLHSRIRVHKIKNGFLDSNEIK